MATANPTTAIQKKVEVSINDGKTFSEEIFFLHLESVGNVTSEKEIKVKDGEGFSGAFKQIQFRFDKDRNYIYTKFDNNQKEFDEKYKGTALEFSISGLSAGNANTVIRTGKTNSANDVSEKHNGPAELVKVIVETKASSEVRSNTSDVDVFGIRKIYSTKQKGIEWFMNMDDLEEEGRVKLRGTAQKKNGHWRGKVDSGMSPPSFRVSVSAKKGVGGDDATPNHTEADKNGFMASPDDWKNIEVTGYFKIEKTDNDDEEITMYCRGGTHNDDDGGCRGTAYKPGIQYNGKPNFAKEYWHSDGTWLKDDKGFKNIKGPGAIVGKWIGQKAVVYDMKQDGQARVKIELYYDTVSDDDLNSPPNNWKKFYELIDDGTNLGDLGKSQCKTVKNNKSEIFTWGGPIVTVRIDEIDGVLFKWLSVREIQPPSL
jgi:hypothetical protein